MAMHGKSKHTAWKRDGVRGKKIQKRLTKKFERNKIKLKLKRTVRNGIIE